MERRFCSECGMPVEECTCGASARATTGFGSIKVDQEEANQSGAYFIKRFNRIALIQDEIVVKQYHIGEFSKGLSSAGRGSASIIITNKRVISKQDSDYLGSSSVSVEEITLDNIAGVKNYYSQGYTIWRIIAGVFATLSGLICIFSGYGNTIIGLVLLAIGIYMFITCRKPSYLFSVYAGSVTSAMEMGANLRGKVFNSNGNGILFQYKPTKEAVKMMCEIGACIVDLKTKGDYAIEAWKKA